MAVTLIRGSEQIRDASVPLTKLESITDGHIIVGAVTTGVPTSVAMSGEASIINTGAVTLNRAAVVAKALTEFSSTTGAVNSSDTIVGAISKLDGNDGLRVLKAGDTMTGTLEMANQNIIKFDELTANGSNFVSLKAAVSLAVNTAYVLPTADGTAGQVLSTDASGNMSWVSRDVVRTPSALSTSTTGVSLGGTPSTSLLAAASIDIATAASGVQGLLSAADWATFSAMLPKAGGTMTGTLTMSGAGIVIPAGQVVQLVDQPLAATDAANKAYVDAVAAGLSPHASVVAATVSADLGANFVHVGPQGVNDTLTDGTAGSTLILDGVTITSGQRVLVKNQTDQKQNGIYTLTTVGNPTTPTKWVLTRAVDFDGNPTSEVTPGEYVFVSGGSQANTSWTTVLHGSNPIIIDTDIVDFTQFAGAGSYTAGNMLTLTGNTFSLKNNAASAAQLIVADATSHVPAYVSMGSQATMDSSGNVTLDNAAVIAKTLTAYASTTGAITSADSILSAIEKLDGNKEPNVTKGNLTDAGTDGITVTGGTGAVIGSGTSLSQHVADSTHNGYLSSTDWSAFDAKITLAKYIVRENKTGTGTSFILTNACVAGTEMLFLNGMLLQSGGEDYTISGQNITTNYSLVAGDRLLVTYIKA